MSDDKEYIGYAGQNKLKANLISIVTKAQIDVTEIIYQLEVYEDIFSPFMSGNITLIDTGNLPSNFPIIGEEMLELIWESPGLNSVQRKIFHIYKMSNKRVQTDKKSVYLLHFTSLSGYKDLNQRVSKAFSGKPTEIAQQVFDKYLRSDDDKKDNADWSLGDADYQATNEIKFISNWWNPSRIMTYLASLAEYTPKDTGSNRIPNFLFFEAASDFYFAPLDHLIRADPKCEYIVDEHTGMSRDANGDAIPDIGRQFKMVHNIEYLENFDYLKRSMSGALSHQVFEYNLVTKRWSAKGNRSKDKEEAKLDTGKLWWNGPRPDGGAENQSAYDLGGYYYNWHYGEDFDKTNHCDDGITDQAKHKDPGVLQGDFVSWNDVNAKISTKITHSGLFDGVPDNTAEILTKRLPLLAQTEMVKFRITVPGRSDLEVGDTIFLQLPSMKQISAIQNPDKNDVIDKYWSGKYLISNIKHVMTPKEHMAIIDICRDASSVDFDYTWPGKAVDD